MWELGGGDEAWSPSRLGLHRCVQLLLQHGASVNSQTEEEKDTALHVASRHGLAEHVQLLLHQGAELEVKNKEGQTPLNAACAQQHQPQDMDRYYRVCQLLVDSGASINAEDRDRQHPLHLACKNANAQIAELLLARGANVNVMNYGGNMALHNILQVAAYKLEHHPELVVRALLNHGAVRIWPGSLLKVRGVCWEGRAGNTTRAPVDPPVTARLVPRQPVCCPALPSALEGRTGIIGMGIPDVFSWGVFCCSTLLLLSAKLCGQHSPSFHYYLLCKLLVLFLWRCFFSGAHPPAPAVSARHPQTKG